MARAIPPGQEMWFAYGDGTYGKVTVVERGTGGHVFKTGKKPDKPYVVEDDDRDRFIVGYDSLHDSPQEAAIEAAKLAQKHGIVVSNPSEPDDDEDDEPDDETDEDPE